VLVARFLTAILVIPILIGMAFDDGWFFRLGLFATGLLGTWEVLWMARQAGHRPLALPAFLLTVTILADASGVPLALLGSAAPPPGTLLGPALGLIVALSLVLLLFRTGHQGSLTDWALTLALPLYVAGLLQFFAQLRYRYDAGPWLTWPAMVLTTSWACDIVAFFAGRAFGRTRLAPEISPAKSREGAVAGLLAATAAGAVYTLVTGLDPIRMAGFGLAVGLGSVVGDLVESLLKRQCGVKDSGFIMPGHGGILDRMDALIFSAATANFYLWLVL
jgi:phosphatidate cytidylyltransferase